MAGIYIHIPFCKQACHYCDFHFSTSVKYKDEMLDAILKEIVLQKKYLDSEQVETIYFGGGTPSLLGDDEINRLIDTISQNFTIANEPEITLEANPDDLVPQRINALRQTPVSRLSIGIQSFFDEDLQWMNRAHRAGEAELSIKRIQDAGFENITADLIFGYPLLSDQKWQHNVERLLTFEIPHISAYSMTVEPKTALESFISKKLYPPMDEQQSARQFSYLSDTLQQNGFNHYEISNYARPGMYSRHNTNYWRGVKYLGVGPSAHSFNGEHRQWNIANNAKYLESIRAGRIPAEQEVLTQTDQLNEYIMTSLRTMWGLNLEKLESIAPGSSAVLNIAAEKFITDGYLSQTANILYLTGKGKLYADNIAAELFFD